MKLVLKTYIVRMKCEVILLIAMYGIIDSILCAGSEGSASRLPVLSLVHINTGTILLDVLCAR